jgi:hypothetical protein
MAAPGISAFFDMGNVFSTGASISS